MHWTTSCISINHVFSNRIWPNTWTRFFDNFVPITKVSNLDKNCRERFAAAAQKKLGAIHLAILKRNMSFDNLESLIMAASVCNFFAFHSREREEIRHATYERKINCKINNFRPLTWLYLRLLLHNMIHSRDQLCKIFYVTSKNIAAPYASANFLYWPLPFREKPHTFPFVSCRPGPMTRVASPSRIRSTSFPELSVVSSSFWSSSFWPWPYP